METLTRRLLIPLLMLLILAGCSPPPQDGTPSGGDETPPETEQTPPRTDQTLPQATPPEEMSTWDVARAMSPGWNLGNSLDAVPYENSWNNAPVTEDVIEGIIGQGFNSIRLPATWEAKMGPGPGYTVSEAWLERVEEVVDWIISRNVYCVLNVHHDSGGWLLDIAKDEDGVTGRFEKLWEQIAARFRDKSHYLIFEAVNEPDKITAAQMNRLNGVYLQAVRSSGGGNAARHLMLGGAGNNAEKTVRDVVLPQDERIMMTFHFYSPWSFLSNWWGQTTWGSDKDRADAKREFTLVYDAYVSKGIPVVIGEYGAATHIYEPSMLFWYDWVGGTAYEHQMTAMWWDNGEHYMRVADAFLNPRINDVIQAAAGGERSTILTPGECYVTADGKPHTGRFAMDKENELLSVTYNGEAVPYNTEGRDVIIDGDFFLRFANGGYGDKGRLIFHFDGGADYQMQIAVTGTPAVESAELEHAAGDIFIPVEYNGCKLATVKAVYLESGKSACPDDWTEYLKYDEHFKRSYSGVTLTGAALAKVREGPVVYTLLFWGGDPIEITVTQK